MQTLDIVVLTLMVIFCVISLLIGIRYVKEANAEFSDKPQLSKRQKHIMANRDVFGVNDAEADDDMQDTIHTIPAKDLGLSD